jgi:hypothetical protein
VQRRSQRRYLDENIDSLDIELTPADLERIEEVPRRGAASGNRYHEAGTRTIDG